MDKEINFYFGIGSRYSYLASTQLDRIERETGFNFVWHPIYSPDLIKKTSGVIYSDSKIGSLNNLFREKDVQRWADLYGCCYNDPSSLNLDYKLLSKACLIAKDEKVTKKFAQLIWKEIFSQNSKLDTLSLIRTVAEKINMRMSKNDLFKHDLELRIQNTINKSIMKGIFGVPTFVVEDKSELFWGQDKLVLLEHYLKNKA